MILINLEGSVLLLEPLVSEIWGENVYFHSLLVPLKCQTGTQHFNRNFYFIFDCCKFISI